MELLNRHIKSSPRKTKQEWADLFGISRPFLAGLLDGTRNPSLDVALRIQSGTNGAVKVSDWPHFKEILAAAEKNEAI